jgi:hypothetical protein
MRINKHCYHGLPALPKYFIALGLCTIFVMASSGVFAQKKPQWLKSPEEAFDRNTTFYAIGFGDDRNKARENALENLTGSITAKIQVVSESSEKEIVQRYGGDNNDFIYSSTYKSKIAVTSENKLYDVQFEYYEPRKGQVYAIGYFDRQKVTTICKQYLSENNQNIQQLLLPANSLLQQYSNYLQTQELAKNNQMLIALLRVIDPDHQEAVSAIDPISIQQMITQLIDDITFQIIVQPDDERLKSQIIEFVNESGFSVVGQNATYILKADVGFTEITSDIPDYISRKWNLSLTLLDGNVVSGSYTQSGIQDHFSQDEVYGAVFKKIGDKILKNSVVQQSLFGYE